MKHLTRFNVVACISCACVAAFVAAHDVPPEQRLVAALLGVLGLAILTALVITVVGWLERERRTPKSGAGEAFPRGTRQRPPLPSHQKGRPCP